MSTPQEELSQIANEIDQLVAKADRPEIQAAITRLIRESVNLSSETPDSLAMLTGRDVVAAAQEFISPSTSSLIEYNGESEDGFTSKKSTIISILTICMENSSDSFLTQKVEEIRGLLVPTFGEVMGELISQGQDQESEATGHSTRKYMRNTLLVTAITSNATTNQLKKLAELARQCATHLSRKQSRPQEVKASGSDSQEKGPSASKIFIGHGRSLDWLELQRYVAQELKLDVDEFNRVTVTGMATLARLSQMLNDVAIAFLVMTGEDEHPDGTLHPRLNVAHELGLFQGKLGPHKAIILLEDGCEVFSNIKGLEHIPFPKGRIDSTFYKVQKVLEREGLL